MKRLVSLLLVLSIVFTTIPAAVFAAPDTSAVSVELENPFTDVRESDWFYDDVQYARINGFFNGITETIFSPDGTMTRGMFVTVLGRMAGVDATAYKGETPFKDVSADKYYAPYVAWAAKHGITSGMEQDKFWPDYTVNRQQMATFFVRYFELFHVDYQTSKNYTNLPGDFDTIAPWAIDAVKKMWSRGLLYGDGINFYPTQNATRVQNAALARRTDNVVQIWYKEPGVVSERVKINPKTGLPYGDVGTSVPSVPSGNATTCAVSFYDGTNLIDTLYAKKNQPLGAVPAVEKSSKLNAILVGYYTDAACTKPFYAEEPVTGDMKVYAKYEEMGSTEELSFTSFAQMDQEPNVAFEVAGSGKPEKAVTLEVMDGSEPVELKFDTIQGGYRVYAPEGFNKGASYQLHLADGWTFKDKPDTIRSASFSIAMEEVENLEMSDAIKYIKDTEEIQYTVGGKTHDVLTSSLVTEKGGSFNYSGSDVAVGDILCVYVGVHPTEREANEDLLDPAIYVKAKRVSGGVVTFEALGEEDQQMLYDVPDNFPIKVSALPTGNTGTVNISALDAEVYTMMMGKGYDLSTAKEAISVGDFLSLYVTSEDISSENDVYFGQVTAYDAASGMITFEKTTSAAIENSMDLYSEIEIEGGDVVSEEEKEEIEVALLEQVEDSGFAQEAAFMLADIVTKTDGFQNNGTIQDFIVKDASGNVLSGDQLELMSLGRSFELNDDIKMTVELVTDGEQLHFNRGVQLAIGIEAEFEVELESEDKINIELSATFVQEVMIDPEVKGSLVKKKVFGFIPVPIGVKVGATIDIKSFTAFSFEATIYTVEADDELGWDSFKEMAKKELKNLGLEIPKELVEGAKTVKELVDKAKEYEKKAKEIQSKIEAFEGGLVQANQYMADAALIYSELEANGINWKSMEEAFGATNVASNLMDMMELTNETGLSTEYHDSVEALMERYCEMLETESDWITLVEQKILFFEVNVVGLVIGVEANFVVRADMSIAIGSNLEYEVGKRYEFWFKIGLFKPSAGSSTMDLIDERFAFQFYVMGRLGLRAGIKAKLYVGIGTGDLASVGIVAELGPYIKLYGFFVYEYTKYRPANTNKWTSSERMMGALFMEFGLYFILGFEAEALKLFEYSYEFVDEEIPLLTAGNAKYYYQFDYEPAEDESVRVKDADNNSSNGITMKIPDACIGLRYVSLTKGFMAVEALNYDKYIFTLSNPNFTLDQKTGIISVNVPEGERYMECDLTATYKYGKLAFSTYDMSVTIPLVWTSLSDQELSEYYTASVRVGNSEDGYETVWTKRVLKGQNFDLPTEKDIKKLLNWNDYKYKMGDGYGRQKTEGINLIDNTVYDFDVDYKTYSITVTDVQKADGSKGKQTYTARFGEAFDFSDLKATGTVNYDKNVFTAFSELTTKATVTNGDETKPFDLTKAIDSRMADALDKGVTAKANYIDNSVSATFVFTGIEHSAMEMTLRRGDTPPLNDIEVVVDAEGLAILDIYPAIAPMNASTTYQIICGELVGPEATITFEENGGSELADITKVEGSILGTLPTPTRAGHAFDGWYTDARLTNKFELNKMPEGGATLYAKWSAGEYKVTFNVNGGNNLESAEKSKNVIYDETYGALPEPTKSGSGFIGWYTAKDGGEQVTAETKVSITGNQTLYARWKDLKTIGKSVFDFGTVETYTYEKDVERAAVYSYVALSEETFLPDEFTFKYKRQGDTDYVDGLPVNAGNYDVVVSRPADNIYAKFEQEYKGVLKINKAVRPAAAVEVELVKAGLTSMELGVGDAIPDLSEEATLIYNVTDSKGNAYSSLGGDSVVHSIDREAKITSASVKVLEPNYEDWTSTPVKCNFALEAAPTTSWKGNADTSWYNETDTKFTLTTAAQLAGLAELVNAGKDMAGKTIKLGNDIDVRAHVWMPIGNGLSHPFCGVFDGQGHVISGVYYNDEKTEIVGLFGYIYSNYANGSKAEVKNVVLDDGFIYGKAYVGGIVGYVENATVQNCTNYAYIKANELSRSDDYISAAGGITGDLYGHGEHGVFVSNCVNYGTVYAQGRQTGGISGRFAGLGAVVNNVNFGSVTGSSRVGGVVGLSEKINSLPEIYNNYNVGKVRPNDGSNDYIGAIVGRNVSDNGVVQYNYYLQDCAKGGNGKSRSALGKDGGSVTDGATKGGHAYYASSFTSLNSVMNKSAGAYAGKTLLEALNAWLQSEGDQFDGLREAWTATGHDGYPLPHAASTASLR